MKIQSLTLKHFSSHAESSLQFEKPMAFIVGGLNVGKSSILAAIEYALLGECNGYRKRTDDKTEIVHQNGRQASQQFSVDLVADKLHAKQVHSANGAAFEFNGNVQENAGIFVDAVQGTLKCSKATISAVLNTGNFFDLPSAEQKELILKLMRADVTPARVRALYEGDPTHLNLVPGDLNSAFALDKAYDYAYARRRDVNRDLKALRPGPAPEGPAPQIDKIKKLLEELDGQLQGKIREQGELRGGVAAWRSYQHLQEKLKADKAEFEALFQTEDPQQIEKLEDMLITAQEARTSAAAFAPAMTEKLIDTKARIVAATGRLETLRRFTGRCMFADVDCAAAEADITTVIKFTESELARLAEQEKAIAAEHDRLCVQRDDIRAERAIENQLTTLKQAVKERARLGHEINTMERELRTAPAPPNDAEATDRLDGEIETLRNRIASGRAKLEGALAWIERQRQIEAVAAQRKKLETELQTLESLVQFLGPNGVKVKLIDEKIHDFESAINEHLHPLGFTLKIQVDPWKIIARDRSMRRLSRSELFRLSVCLQIAIAKMTGINAVCVDDAEMLTPDVRTTLFKLLLKSGLDQAIVAMTLMDEAAFLESRKKFPESVEVFMVRNAGGVSQVEKL